MSDILKPKGGAKSKAKTKSKSVLKPRKPISIKSVSNKIKISTDFDRDEVYLVADGEFKFRGVSAHHLDSIDNFYTIGLKEIITRVFTIEKWILNKRDKTDEDKRIKSIHVNVELSNVRLIKPQTSLELVKQIPLWPVAAVRGNKTYSSKLYVDAKITATAHNKDDTTKVREQIVKDLHIAAIPVVVKSKLCHTYGRSKDALINMEEDPSDSGGYIPIKGVEWVVDNIESILFNQIRVFKNIGHLREIARGEIISKPGDSYENSIETIIRLLNDGRLTIEIIHGGVREIQFPFYLIFRALGWGGDETIVESITYGGTDEISKQLEDILDKAFIANYTKDNKHKKNLGSGVNIYKQDEVLSYMATNMPTDNWAHLDPINNEDHKQQILGDLKKLFDNYLLPHMGNDSTARHNKLKFLGHIVHKMLLVHIGVLDETDRDSYITKRIHSAGPSFAKTLKTYFNQAIVMQIKKRFSKEFRVLSFSDVNLQHALTAAIQGLEFERLLTQAITSGNKATLKISRQRTIVNRLTTQILNRKNQLAALSTLRMINSPHADSASKASRRALEMRQVHMSFVGYGCLVQSPDSGEKVGLHKQMALTSSISLAGSSVILKEILIEDPELLPLTTLNLKEVARRRLSKVFVNGVWMGCVEKSYEMRWKYIKLRRNKKIDPMTTIHWDVKSDELYFWVDVGRITRPLLIVYNTHRDAPELGLGDTKGEKYMGETGRRSGLKKKTKFTQGLALTGKHVEGLKDGTITMDDLLDAKVIEYITPSEQTTLYLCPNIDELKRNADNELKEYTHCDIPESLLGIPALTGPLANRNQTPRNSFQTSQIKQACGWPFLNWPYRIDKDTFFQYLNEYPLVKTKANNYIFPNGMNTIVAIMCYTGFNEEDSIIWNKAAIHRQMFTGFIMDYVKTELDKNEEFGPIDFQNTKDLKAREDKYSKLDAKGIIPIGTIVENGDVMIAKYRKLSRAQAQEEEKKYVDQSMIYRDKKPSIVSVVIKDKNSDDIEFIKVSLRKIREVNMGDKFSMFGTAEVLTDSGWVAFKDVTLDCKVASLRDGKNIEYIKPSAISSYDYDGGMYHLKTQQVHTVCTLNHKLYVKKRHHKQFELIEAQNVMGKRVRFKKDGIIDTPDIKELTFNVNGCGISYDADWFLQLLGMFIADGCTSRKNIIILAGTKQRKIDYHKEICENLNLEYEYHGEKVKTPLFNGTYINNYYIYKIFKPWSVGALNKSLPKFVWDLNTNQSRILLNALIAGDGSHNNQGSVCYYTSSVKLANDVQRLALHAGWSGCIKLIRPAGTESVIKATGQIIRSNADTLSVRIVKTKNMPQINHGHTHEQKIQEEKIIQYKGKVYCLEVPKTHLMYCRENKYSPPCWSGNSARSGQKAICGLTLRESDMPYTMDGLKPDIILNPHAKPSRMTMGQLEESGIALVAAAQGVTMDATIFTQVDLESICNALEANGFNRYGNQRLFSGFTGEWINGMIFMGPTYYQRLQKFVSKQIYAITSGPTDIITRQPLDGKASRGGIRVGEMEKDVLVAHGCAEFFREKFLNNSDKFKTYICRLCGNFAIVNKESCEYYCKQCEDLADIGEVRTSWSSKLFLQQLAAMNISVSIGLKPYTFEEPMP